MKVGAGAVEAGGAGCNSPVADRNERSCLRVFEVFLGDNVPLNCFAAKRRAI